VDDGTVSGATVVAAAKFIRKVYNPEKLRIKLPVASKETAGLLRREAHYVEVVMTPFLAIL
jgi:predicted phosphoribosyltransferase